MRGLTIGISVVVCIKAHTMFPSFLAHDSHPVPTITFLLLLETIDNMMFPSFKRPALFALSASTAVMAQMTTSGFSPTNAVSDTPSAQITSASSSASIGTVLLHGTPTT